MEEIKYNEMTEYCEAIKRYIDAFSKSQDDMQVHGDVKLKLKELLNNSAIDETTFFLSVQENIKATTHFLQRHLSGILFFKWNGEEGSFTRNHFIKTMKTVWPDL